jgi:hypothetical protein
MARYGVHRVGALALVAALGGAAGAACSSMPPPVAPAAEGAASVPAPPPPLRPLTSEEEALRADLQTECGALAELGPRSLVHSWNLHSATDHLARKLEVLGYEVVRQGFPVGDEVLQNLEVVVPGTRTSETLVVAAHYDSAGESVGANASASGAVALLALAKGLVGKRYARGVRLVWLSNESGAGGPPGSAVYAAGARHRNLPVVATLTLGSLGNYSLVNGSQTYPVEALDLGEKRSHVGNFVAVLSNAGSGALLDRVRPALSSASLPVEELVLPEQAPLAADGPQARFWNAGLAGLVLTDTAQFRTPYPEGPQDTLDKLDFDRLTRVTRLLSTLVITLADAPLESTPEAPPAAATPGEMAPGQMLPELPPMQRRPAAPPG